MCGVIIFIALLVTFGVVMLSVGFQVLALSALVVGGALLALFPVMKKGMSKMGIVLCVVFGLLLIVGGILLADTAFNNKTEAPEEPVVTWQETFIEHGFTETEVEKYNSMFIELGVTEFGDITFRDNGIMKVAQCEEVFGSDKYHLHITFENREIIYVRLIWTKYGYKDGADLFYDTDGGYLAKVIWEENKIVDMEGNLLAKIY